MPSFKCDHCGEFHDYSQMEPNRRRPDAALGVPEEKRGVLTSETRSACIVFSHPPKSLLCRLKLRDPNPRFFLRVLMPFLVEGRNAPLSWGIWVEVEESQYNRVMQLWDDPERYREPAFSASLANNVSGYPETLGLSGTFRLQPGESVPKFTLDPDDHPLVAEQVSGVTEERVFEWLSPYLHHGRPDA